MKEQAEFYRQALMGGLVEVGEVIDWCDSIIMSEASPGIAIIEASISGSAGRYSVADSLAEVAGEYSKQRVRSRLFGAMHEVVSHDRNQALGIVQVLYQMALDDGVPLEGDEAEMWYFDDAIDLATDGIHGDEKELVDEMLQFLKARSSG